VRLTLPPRPEGRRGLFVSNQLPVMQGPVITVDGKEQVELPDELFQVLVIDEGIPVTPPENFLPIDWESCVKECTTIEEDEWRAVRESEVFRILWVEYYQPGPYPPAAPATVAELQSSDELTRYVVGLIVRYVEAQFQGLSPYIALPRQIAEVSEKNIINVLNLGRGILGGEKHMLDADREVLEALGKIKEEGREPTPEELEKFTAEATARVEQRITQNLAIYAAQYGQADNPS
jgi:hypothetical protein